MILCPLALNLPYSFDMHGIHNSNMYYNESQLYLYPYQEYMYMQVHKPSTQIHLQSSQYED